MLSEGDLFVSSGMASHIFSGLSSPQVDTSEMHLCPQLNNASECSWTTNRLAEGNNLVMAVYNPASWKVDYVVR